MPLKGQYPLTVLLTENKADKNGKIRKNLTSARMLFALWRGAGVLFSEKTVRNSVLVSAKKKARQKETPKRGFRRLQTATRAACP